MNSVEKLARASKGTHLLYQPSHELSLPVMGTSCGYTTEIDHRYDWHGLKRGSSPFTLFQYTISGKGMLKYEGQTFEMAQGQAMILHFPHDNHYWLPKGWEPWTFIYLCITGPESVKTSIALEKRCGPVLNIKDDSKALKTCIDIYLNSDSNTPMSLYESSSRCYQFFMELLNEFYNLRPVQSDENIDKVLDFMNANFHEKIDVDDMAKISGYSRYHFSRLFQESLGIPPATYLNQLRLKKAAILLREKENSIKRIALDCGYSDLNYFCKIFKRTYGMTPGTYRKSGM